MGSSPTPDPPPSEVPLTGADCFLRAFDHQTRRISGASHVSQHVLRLGPGYDVEIFRKLVEEAALLGESCLLEMEVRPVARHRRHRLRRVPKEEAEGEVLEERR